MSEPKIIIIAALAENRVIGNKNRLPWNVPAEYEHFKSSVQNSTMIMGKNAYENFETEGFESVKIIVLSKSLGVEEIRHPGGAILDNVDVAMERARSWGRTIFIGGGASIYALMMPRADEMWLSFIPGTHEGDVFFPKWEESEWEISRTEQHPGFEFRVYKRTRR
ncbi:MAG: dihydrofolate reductase [Parcubacteria group bacterium]|nr:dihydrofolate reductase [Parcubacteria group bacterium]